MSESDFDRATRETLDPADSLELVRGTLVDGRYRVLGHVGQGAMGSVYEVEDEHLEERIALKLLHPHLSDDRDFRAQLRDEVRFARRVSHPNVCRVHDLGRHGHSLFVTMELIRGESLRQIMRSGETPHLAKRVDILIQLCSALAAAHRAGVLHRDVKPDNVLVAEDRAVLTDFGVASRIDGAKNFAGTAAYMAPEIMLGASPDQRIDVYACGVVAFELLSGQLPFDIASISECIRHAENPSAYPGLHPGAAPSSVREALDAVLAMALSPDPADRPRDIDKLAEALSRASRGELAAAPRLARGTTANTAAETDGGRARARVATAMVFRTNDAISAEDLERVVSDWGGYLTASDAGMVRAVFGAPVARGDDALRAAMASRDLIERFGGLAAIDTRRVSFQLASDGTLLGLEDEFAALEGLMTRDGELGCSASAAHHIASQFVCEPRGKTWTDGSEEARSRFAVTGRVRPLDSGAGPLVGRDRELASLERATRVAFEERRPVLIQVVGDPGVGKTRLRLELAREIGARREVEWLIGHSAPAQPSPLLVLRSADTSWYRAVRGAPPGDGQNALAAARAWLLKRAARRPVALVIEDAHWADAATLEFVSSLETMARSAPIAVVVLARQPVIETAQTIRLESLGSADAANLIRRLSPELDAASVTAISRRAGGNPLFIAELVRSANQEVPATVEAAIQGRADRLADQTRAVLEAAAVLGLELDRDSLAALLDGVTDEALEDELTRLVSKGELAADDDGNYRFTSPLIRDVVYAQLDAQASADLHARAARYLQSSEPCAGLDAALGHHWLAAGESELARDAFRRAGCEALELYAYNDALVALEHAEQLTEESERDAELLELVGDALLDRDATAAHERFEAALAARGDDEREARANLSVKLAVTSSSVADHLLAVRYLEAGLAIADVGGGVSDVTRARILAQLGWVLGYKLGDNERGLRCSEEAVALLESSGERRALARALSRLGGNYMRAGRWRDQLACNQKNLAIARELGDARGLLTANINLGFNYSNLGELDLALKHTFAALEIATREGHTRQEPLIRNNLGGMLLESGELEAAESQLLASIELAKAVGREYMLAEAYWTLARLAYRREEYAEAATRADQALAQARGSGAKIDVGIALRICAGIAGRREQKAAAARLFAESRETLAESDPSEYARTLIAEARWLRRSDSSSDWRRAAELHAEGKLALEHFGAGADLRHLEDEDDLR